MTAVLDARFLSGDILPAAESLEKYHHDKIEPIQDLYRLFDQESFKDWKRRAGQVLHSSEVIYRILRLNPCLIIQHQRNFEDEWGLYFPGQRLIYLSGFHNGWLTEFSYTL